MDKQTESRESFAQQNGMTMEFVNWFFDNKKDGCGNVWFMMAAAMWEGWKGRGESLVVDIDWPEANDDHWKDGEEGAYAQGYEVGKDLTAIKVRQALQAIGIRIKGEGV